MANLAGRPPWPWHARIRRSAKAAPHGAGLLFADLHIVTCAHVVASGQTLPREPVLVDFQFVARHEPIPAQVVEGGWYPKQPDGSGDIAILRLCDAPPAEARPAPLREARSVWDHRFRSYGYPRGHEHHGVPARGLIVGDAEAEWVQLEADSRSGHLVQRGFSGAPIWDEVLQAVIGIVVGKDKDTSARAGYAIPIEVIGRYWPDLQPWVGWRLSHDSDLNTHWSPRSRGVDVDSRPGWYFTGRRKVFRELVRWLEHDRADGRVRVVTGGPGSGKSAVLGRLLALADPHHRALMEREDPEQLGDPSGVPSIGRVSLAVHTRGLDLAEVCRRIGHALSYPAAEPSALIKLVQERGQSTVVVVDALDEAVTSTEARAIAGTLLAPLARDAAGIGVKVLVGTRKGPGDIYLRACGSRPEIIDLDDIEHYFEFPDLVDYAERSLRLDFDPTVRSPYRDEPVTTGKVAEAIARSAQRSFLVAGLAARARAESRTVIDVSIDGWDRQENFPRDADMAMAEYLDRLDDRQRALDLLVPIAYARPPGLPRNTLWQELANAYSGKSYGAADITWLLRTAASYLLEQTDVDGTAVVQLFHETLVEHIRSLTPISMVESRSVSTLRQQVEAAGGSGRSAKSLGLVSA